MLTWLGQMNSDTMIVGTQPVVQTCSSNGASRSPHRHQVGICSHVVTLAAQARRKHLQSIAPARTTCPESNNGSL